MLSLALSRMPHHGCVASSLPLLSVRHCASWQSQVARGGESHEVLPMLLIVPTWFGGASGEMALLGFGDVVLPGLLLVYTRVFDFAASQEPLQQLLCAC